MVYIYQDLIKCRNGEKEKKYIFNTWIHFYCYLDNSNSFKMELLSDDELINTPDPIPITSGWTIFTTDKITFYNKENTITSPGIMLIRQFKLWNDLSKINKDIFYKEFNNQFNKNLLFSIDSLIKPYQNFSFYYSSNVISSITIKPNDLITDFGSTVITRNIEPFYGYYPLNDDLPQIELCK